jgi:hypothetical protein
MKREFLLAAVSVLALSACGQAEPISYESLVWVNNYYVEHPVQSITASAGGWLFRGAREFGADIRVGFLVPGPMNPDPAKRQAVLNTLCPAKSEVIWQTLPSDNKVVINVWTKDRNSRT